MTATTIEAPSAGKDDVLSLGAARPGPWQAMGGERRLPQSLPMDRFRKSRVVLDLCQRPLPHQGSCARFAKVRHGPTRPNGEPLTCANVWMGRAESSPGKSVVLWLATFSAKGC